MRILILFILSISNLLTCSLVDSVTQSLVDSEHQFHLLQVSIADSLYKSYLPQHNFEEVKAAVDFFELEVDETDDILLIYNCARAHYYHAVGLTERDDIIGACEHYLRALELMETNFATQNLSDLDYDKTRFMALIYTRLGRLFLNENYCDLAIIKYNKALKYVELMNDTYAEANILKGLAHAYHLSGEADSALYYYNKSLRSDPDLHNRLDVEKSIAKILFDKGEKDSAYVLITNNLDKMEDYSARNSYYHLLGEMYYKDKVYDTAIYYLKSLLISNNKHMIISSSECLSSIYDSLGDSKMKGYYDSIVLSQLIRINNGLVNATKLQSVYNDYEKRKIEREQILLNRLYIKNIIYAIIFIVVLLILILILRYKVKNKEEIISNTRIKLDEVTIKFHEQDAELKEIKYRSKKTSKQRLKDFRNTDNSRRILINIADIKNKGLKVTNLSPLTNEELTTLLYDVDTHLDNYIQKLSNKYPKLKKEDLYCICLLLLDINGTTIAPLMNRSYNAIWNRITKIYSILGIKSEQELHMLIK
ncbi:MAG: hypothetical protein IJE76_07175 [Bacteroidales bacterium]|nr:hypothetical protein [Bacteroidales bacterium]